MQAGRGEPEPEPRKAQPSEAPSSAPSIVPAASVTGQTPVPPHPSSAKPPSTVPVQAPSGPGESVSTVPGTLSSVPEEALFGAPAQAPVPGKAPPSVPHAEDAVSPEGRDSVLSRSLSQEMEGSAGSPALTRTSYLRSSSTLMLGASPPIRSPATKKVKFLAGVHSYQANPLQVGLDYESGCLASTYCVVVRNPVPI